MVEPATGKLRELQLMEAEMLSDFKKVCEKNGLTYYLDYGTLLGAVRHKGFIPWDDDIDVSMPYEDYLKFLQIGQKELGEKYFLQTEETDVNYYRSYAKIRRNGTTYLAKHQIDWDVHHGVWMDVFPIVEINPGIEYKLKSIMFRLSNFMLMDNFFATRPEEFRKVIGKFGMWLVKVFHKTPRRKRLKFKTWFLKGIYRAKNKKCKSIIWMALSKTYPADAFEGVCKVEFEGEEYDTHRQYKQLLELYYGDYMKLPPEDQRKGHGGATILDLENNYTVYTKQNETAEQN